MEVANSPIMIFVSPNILKDHMGNLYDAPRLELVTRQNFAWKELVKTLNLMTAFHSIDAFGPIYIVLQF